MILWIGSWDWTQVGLSLLHVCQLGSLSHLCQVASIICLIVGWLSITVMEKTDSCVIYHLLCWLGSFMWCMMITKSTKREQDPLYKHFLSLSLLLFAIVTLVKVNHMTKLRAGWEETTQGHWCRKGIYCGHFISDTLSYNW